MERVMVFWLLAGLAVLLVNIYLSAALYLPTEGLDAHLRGRDRQVDRGVLAARVERALVNLKENMPFFLVLGLLALIVEGAEMGQAVLGSQIFVLARIAYIPAYLSAIPGLRSVMYGIASVGLVMMLLAVI